MPGIYIHIPFCRQACHYCNFHFSVSQKRKPEFLQALQKEIEMQKDFFASAGLNDAEPDTVYLGGGTPSVLTSPELNEIFGRLQEYFPWDADAEITLEANPDDLSHEKLEELKDSPVNRLSIGIQSFREEDLRYMNRSHNAGQARAALENALKVGFKNITADLIYGTPGMTDEQWEQNILQLIELGIPHISAYSLTVEKKTALDVFIRQGKAAPVEEEQSARQFEILCEITDRFGYAHYEISNFGKPGYFSRHNMSYWSGVPYLGLGPSAHSFVPGQRRWNVANTCLYIDELMQGRMASEEEILSRDQQFNEYIMTALRTMWGVDLKKVSEGFGQEYMQHLKKESAHFIAKGLMEEKEDILVITEKGKFLADGIAAELFIV